MEKHIGQLIKERLEATGMKKSEFARRINRTPQNVYDVFQRKSIDTELLATISSILHYNFFESLYIQHEAGQGNSLELQELTAKYGTTTNMLHAFNQTQQALEQCEQQTNQLGKEVDYLKEINKLLKKK